MSKYELIVTLLTPEEENEFGKRSSTPEGILEELPMIVNEIKEELDSAEDNEDRKEYTKGSYFWDDTPANEKEAMKAEDLKQWQINELCSIQAGLDDIMLDQLPVDEELPKRIREVIRTMTDEEEVKKSNSVH